MRAGDLVFVNGGTWISKLVTLFDGGGRWSHVAVAVSETEIIEAEYSTRVRITEMKYADYEVIPMNLTPAEQKTLVEVAHQLEGQWYDYRQIVWYVLRNLFAIKKAPMWNNPNALICSEVVFILFSAIDRIYGDAYITPNELYALMQISRENL